jgi:hypothetical protein
MARRRTKLYEPVRRRRYGMSRAANTPIDAARAQTHLGRELAGPERLVGLGFRYWLAGYRTGDIACWERAWHDYESALGPTAAKGALTDLSCWVRAINRHAQRELETSIVDCVRFCRDECVAVAMIAACQHNACPAMRACAFSLLGSSMIEEVVQGAESFAATMRDADQLLAASPAAGSCLLGMPAATHVRQ